jgi:hypothetical protein
MKKSQPKLEWWRTGTAKSASFKAAKSESASTDHWKAFFQSRLVRGAAIVPYSLMKHQ